MSTLHSLAGIAALLLLTLALSESRRTVPWRLVVIGLALSFGLAAAMLRLPPVMSAMGALNSGVTTLEQATQAGTALVFGYLGGAPLPFAETQPGASFVLAFRALPLILVIGALSALLFHWRVLPLIVQAFTFVLRRTMGIGGAVGVSAAANVFVGMVEAPLVVRPYLARMSRGELLMVMNCGMSTIAGTMLVLYASILGPVLPDALTHLLVASFAATPLALVVAAVMIPPGTLDNTDVQLVREDPSAMAAATRGALEGLSLLLNVVALLIVFVALVALADAAMGLMPAVFGAPLTLARLFGWLFAPLAWCCGVPWSEAMVAGALLGKKLVLTEFVAYLDMAHLPAEALSQRSRTLMTYALCGFANFASLGIMLGGMAGMLPAERRGEVATLGMRSVVAGVITTCMTAAVVSLLV